MLTVADLQALVPDAGIGEAVAAADRRRPGRSGRHRRPDHRRAAGIDPSAQVTGLVTLRDQINEVLDLLLLVVTGLLGIAVVIALIGVGNTLALSVVERRQENGLLRALGLTRGQLRGLLAWEAVLVAGVAAVLGVLLGGAYGLIGAASVLGEVGEVVLAVPWLQVGAIVVVATLAGCSPRCFRPAGPPGRPRWPRSPPDRHGCDVGRHGSDRTASAGTLGPCRPARCSAVPPSPPPSSPVPWAG